MCTKWIVLFMLFNVKNCLALPVADFEDSDCILDHDGTNPVLDRCLEQGEQFIREYLRHLSRGKLFDFNTCHSYKGFGHCITDLWRRCATIQQVTYKHWRPLVDLFTCSCNTTIEKHECHHARQCLESEFSGILVHRCDDRFKFNVDHDSQNKCTYVRENILCKTALSWSACGEAVGQAAYSLSKINHRRLIDKARCYVSLDQPYHGFSYNESCPRDFKDEVLECYATHLERFKDGFTTENNLIVSGDIRDLKDMCSGWRDYRQCTQTTRDQCREGVDLIYDQDGELRALLLKLDYVCKEVRDPYQDNLVCMQKVLKTQSLDVCNRHWRALEPWLNNTTSLQFYCQPTSDNSYSMMIALEGLRHCYEGVFQYRCSEAAGSTMSELIRRAFDDPFYLRFAYRADCALQETESASSARKRSHPTASSGVDFTGRHTRHRHGEIASDWNAILEPAFPERQQNVHQFSENGRGKEQIASGRSDQNNAPWLREGETRAVHSGSVTLRTPCSQCLLQLWLFLTVLLTHKLVMR